MAIKVLDNLTAEQIAAGEVIENPASVVKELVENSLDAQATLVRISLQEGGKKALTVTDDGCGINPEELPLAFRRFATSKLSSLDDLQRITSLGFRGEALPSVAAVARVTLTTRPVGAVSAARISLAGGKTLSLEEAGAARGTSVEVRDLFYNTPGRLKFLRAASVEASRITVLVSAMALAHPDVSFVVSNEHKTVLISSGDGQLLHVIGAIYGSGCAAAMLPLEESSRSGMSIRGYISVPHFNRASRQQITFVVNGRIVQNSLLVNALERGFGSLLPVRRYPVAVMNLLIPPALLDVNVHPSKTEIRFQEPEAVKELVFRAVKELLQRPASPRRAQIPDYRDSALQPSFWQEGSLRYTLEPELPQGRKVEISVHNWNDGRVGAGTALSDECSPDENTGITEDCRLLGQFLHSYLVAQKGDQLLLIDQHAAHEMVIYEALLKAPEVKREAVQAVLPQTVEVPPSWRVRLEELLPLLNEAGFKMEPFGDNSYIIRAYPFDTRGDLKSSDFFAMLEELLQAGKLPAEKLREQVFKTVSCHRAIKANQPLSRREMEQLLRDWENSGGANYCPHGRPAVLALGRGELDRGFNRKRGGGNGR